jgi:hypothetical protein
MAGYVRQDTSNNIANGNVINADDLDAEFDAIELAFNGSTGHAHDGTAGNGPAIVNLGPSQEITATSSALVPDADDSIDLGSSLLEFKDLYLDGVAYIDTLTADAGTVGGADIVTTSATQTLTNKTITGAASITTTGNVTVGGTLNSTGLATLSNGVNVTGTTAVTGNITVTGTVDGRDVAADGTKLDGIESGATADQTGAEIKSLYEAEADTNAYTDAEKSKLAGIEAGATADQSASEIKTLYESNADTNAFTDAEQTRLGLVTDTEMGILAGATVTTAELNKLDGLAGDVVGTTDTQTLSNKTFTKPALDGAITEEVYTITGTSYQLEPDNGTIQVHVLSADTTYTDGFSEGESITLMIDDASESILTWPTMTWINNQGNAPTLSTTDYTVVAIWKVGSTLYGSLMGDGR